MSLEKVLKITEDEKLAIRKSYDRTDNEIQEEIEAMKEWLKKQPHLPQDEDDTRLKMMLHYNKFSLEKTKNKLDVYYSAKHIVPEFYLNREPLNPLVVTLMDEIIVMPLPNLTPDLHRVYLVKFMGDVKKFSTNVYLKVIFAIMDLKMVFDFSLGDRFLMDFKEVQLGHLVGFTPAVVKKCYEMLHKAYSDKIAGVHFLNLPSYAAPLVALINSVLSEKLANRVHVHKDTNDLREVLSAKVLPNEYGGTAGPTQQLYDEWKTFIRSKNDWLRELGNKKSDESKRIGKPIDSELFGMYGSFRKMTLD